MEKMPSLFTDDQQHTVADPDNWGTEPFSVNLSSSARGGISKEKSPLDNHLCTSDGMR